MTIIDQYGNERISTNEVSKNKKLLKTKEANKFKPKNTKPNKSNDGTITDELNKVHETKNEIKKTKITVISPSEVAKHVNNKNQDIGQAPFIKNNKIKHSVNARLKKQQGNELANFVIDFAKIEENIHLRGLDADEYFKALAEQIKNADGNELRLLMGSIERTKIDNRKFNESSFNQEQITKLAFGPWREEIFGILHDKISNNNDLAANVTMIQMICRFFPTIFESLGDEIRTDKNIILSLMEEAPSISDYIHKSMYSNADFMIDAFKINADIISKIDSSLTNNSSVMLDLLRENYDIAIKKVDKSLFKDENFVLAAIKINQDIILKADVALFKNPVFVLKVINTCPQALSKIPAKYITGSILLEVIKQDPKILSKPIADFKPTDESLRQVCMCNSEVAAGLSPKYRKQAGCLGAELLRAIMSGDEKAGEDVLQEYGNAIAELSDKAEQREYYRMFFRSFYDVESSVDRRVVDLFYGIKHEVRILTAKSGQKNTLEANKASEEIIKIGQKIKETIISENVSLGEKQPKNTLKPVNVRM